jgi:hypothetical protein
VEALPQIQTLLGKWQHEALAILENLPIAAAQREDFTARFLGRSTQKIYNTEFVQDLAPQPQALSWRERLAQRWQQSKEKAYAMVCPQEHKRAQWQYFLVSLAVFIAPQSTDYYQAQQVSDGRPEGFRWGLFLLAMLGSLGFAWLFKKYFALPPDLKRKKKKKARNCYWCCNTTRMAVISTISIFCCIGFGACSAGKFERCGCKTCNYDCERNLGLYLMAICLFFLLIIAFVMLRVLLI